MNQNLNPVLIVFLIVVTLVPVEFSLRAGDIILPWYRSVLLISAFPIGFLLLSGRITFRAFDYVIIFHGLWHGLSQIIKRGVAEGVEPAGSYFIETTIAYFLARLFITNMAQIRQFFALFIALMIIPIALGVVEALVIHSHYVHSWAQTITGMQYNVQNDTRFGVFRAASVFQHPILFGLMCAVPIGLCYFTASNFFLKALRAGVLALGTASSISTAALLTVMIQFTIVAGERVTTGIKNRLQKVLWSIAGLYVFLAVASDRGMIGMIAGGVALNPASGYWRIHQWNYSIDDILRNPLIGILNREWTRPYWLKSLDNHWLVLGFRGGLPTVLSLLLAMILIFRAVHALEARNEQEKGIYLSWLATIFSMFLTGATVNYFGKLQPMMFLYLGMAASMSQFQASAARPAVKLDEEKDDKKIKSVLG